MRSLARVTLPKPGDRLRLGSTGLRVSPVCLGITGSPDTVVAAFETGVNFFFLSADLHWPLYEHTRRGIETLLREKQARRDDIVVGIVSYLDEPLFSALQFHEVIDSVPGLERVDLLIAGAVSNDGGFLPRVRSLQYARSVGHLGARGVGASFHQRSYAVIADQYRLLDLSFVRYNTGHPGARADLFPYLNPSGTGVLFNFKSLLSWVPPEHFARLGVRDPHWTPEPADYYRFALSHPGLDGILCSPSTPEQVGALVRALEKPPLTAEQQEYMIGLSRAAYPVAVMALSASLRPRRGAVSADEQNGGYGGGIVQPQIEIPYTREP